MRNYVILQMREALFIEIFLHNFQYCYEGQNEEEEKFGIKETNL